MQEGVKLSRRKASDSIAVMKMSAWILAVAILSGMAMVSGAETNAPAQFFVSLEDGSRLTAEILLREIPLQVTSVGKLKLPASRIACVQRNGDKTVTVALLNEDHLQGTLSLEVLPLKTILGKLSVPVKLVTEITAVQWAQNAKHGIEVPDTPEGKRKLAQWIIDDARRLDAAIDQWALETGQPDGARIDLRGIANYLKGATILEKGEAPEDILGYKFIIRFVGSNQVKIHPDTKKALQDSDVDWGPY